MRVTVGADVWEIGQAICTEWVDSMRAKGLSIDALEAPYCGKAEELIATIKKAVGDGVTSLCSMTMIW